MRLAGLTLETEYFEDYLSFLTEVLELEMEELTDISMSLKLSNTTLEIKKIPSGPHLVASKLEFVLDEAEFEALIQKVNFFYYRKGPTRFLLLGMVNGTCQLTDPDGRVWRFSSLRPQENSLQL
ncbi:MAG: hypothetical protein AB7I27_00635 [Bacteriovoracaceae bacterium]